MICSVTLRSIFVIATMLLLAMPVFAQKESKRTLELPLEIIDLSSESEAMPVRPRAMAGNHPTQPVTRGMAKRAPGNHALSKPQTEIKVEMPSDATKPVLTMDSVGGFRMKLPDGFETTPMLQVFSDGRILTGRKSPLVKEVEGQLDLVELNALLVFVADDCRFFDITSEMVKSDLEASRVGKIMDASTMEFTVNLKEHSNTVGVYALPHVAGKFAEVPSVAAMVAIASKCRRIISMTRLGSEEEGLVALSSANRSLAEQAPNAPEFTMENLQYAEQFVDGRRSATFTQEFPDAGKTMMAYATFQVDVKGDESVSLNVVQQRGR